MDNISSSTLIVLLLCAVAIAALAWFFFQKRRTETLKTRFGPEYDRAMKQHGSTGRAEAALEQRAKRVDKFKIVELSPADRERFANAWRESMRMAVRRL